MMLCHPPHHCTYRSPLTATVLLSLLGLTLAGPYPYPEEEYSQYGYPEQEERDDRFGEARAFQENEFEVSVSRKMSLRCRVRAGK